MKPEIISPATETLYELLSRCKTPEDYHNLTKTLFKQEAFGVSVKTNTKYYRQHQQQCTTHARLHTRCRWQYHQHQQTHRRTNRTQQL